MSTFTSLTYHLVFGTKYRFERIRPPLQDELYAYIGGIIRGEQGHLIEIGGMPDHVHILTAIPPSLAVSDMLKRIKAKSSKWVNQEHKCAERFEWQIGFGAFTVSHSQIEIVQRYIQNQAEHHRQLTFQEELMMLLRRHAIAFDEQFLFEGEHVG